MIEGRESVHQVAKTASLMTVMLVLTGLSKFNQRRFPLR